MAHLLLTGEVKHKLSVGRIACHGLLTQDGTARLEAHDTVTHVAERGGRDIHNIQLWKGVGELKVMVEEVVKQGETAAAAAAAPAK